MKIDISRVYGDLMYVAKKVGWREYSGNLFAERTEEDIEVYDFVLLDVGSWGYTEIRPELMLPLLDRPDFKNLRGWAHKHPVGDGVPGPHNWSFTDETNIKETPLGGVPELVKWSFSIVLTPGGWVGRIDNHITGKTLHCPVAWFRDAVAEKAEKLIGQTPQHTQAQEAEIRAEGYQLWFGEDGSVCGDDSAYAGEQHLPWSEDRLGEDTFSERTRPCSELDMELHHELFDDEEDLERYLEMYGNDGEEEEIRMDDLFDVERKTW
jgi:hypothetical protein